MIIVEAYETVHMSLVRLVRMYLAGLTEND